jgi:hypothetical protein
MKFIKVIWVLSVAIILIFHIAFEGFRIFDFFTENYSVKTMKILSSNYSSSSKRKSITINGFIDKERVYFSRFDNEIGELFSLYPGIAMENNEIEELSSVFPDTFKNSYNDSKNIEVLKFKNSHIVMLTKDNEFQRWKIRLYLFSLYSLTSIILLILIKKK